MGEPSYIYEQLTCPSIPRGCQSTVIEEMSGCNENYLQISKSWMGFESATKRPEAENMTL